MAKSMRKTLRKAAKAVESPSAELPIRNRPLPQVKILETVEPEETILPRESKRKSSDFVEVQLTGSKGKKYKVVIPASYVKAIPKVWEWTQLHYDIADEIIGGIPMTEIAHKYGMSRSTIYAWLEHPEFKEHIDGQILESGFANKRERISQLTRLSDMLVRKVALELDSLKLTDKSVGPVLTAIHQYAKHIAQEKEEFVEQSKIEQDTSISGSLGVASVNINAALESLPSEERKKLEDEFNAVADNIIRGIVGDK